MNSLRNRHVLRQMRQEMDVRHLEDQWQVAMRVQVLPSANDTSMLAEMTKAIVWMHIGEVVNDSNLMSPFNFINDDYQTAGPFTFSQTHLTFENPLVHYLVETLLSAQK